MQLQGQWQMLHCLALLDQCFQLHVHESTLSGSILQEAYYNNECMYSRIYDWMIHIDAINKVYVCCWILIP